MPKLWWLMRNLFGSEFGQLVTASSFRTKLPILSSVLILMDSNSLHFNLYHLFLPLLQDNAIDGGILQSAWNYLKQIKQSFAQRISWDSTNTEYLCSFCASAYVCYKHMTTSEALLGPCKCWSLMVSVGWGGERRMFPVCAVISPYTLLLH